MALENSSTVHQTYPIMEVSLIKSLFRYIYVDDIVGKHNTGNLC